MTTICEIQNAPSEQELISLTNAAEQGCADSQYRLAEMYRDGEGVPVDPCTATYWYERSLEQDPGNGGPEYYDIGLRFICGGIDRPKSFEQAAYWWAKAVSSGDGFSCSCLGDLYQAGRGVPRDPEKAVALYLQGADNEDSDCYYSLGIAYARGEGVPQDDSLAGKWLDKWATAVHPLGWTPEGALDEA